MGAVLQIDPNSPDWAVVKRWAGERIEAAVANLKSPSLDHDKTMYARGTIAALEELISLPALAQTAAKQVVQPGYED